MSQRLWFWGLPVMALLAGCAHTLNGAQQDVAHDANAVNNVAQNAGTIADQATKTVTTDVKQTAAGVKPETVLVPAVKLAIIRDPVLNDPRNQVHVTADASSLFLRGHVLSTDMRQRAVQDAQKVLTDHHAPQTIKDELTTPGS